MSNDKSLRDIWSVTDKLSMDVLKAAGGVPESCNASVITTASSREKCESYITNQTQESYLKNNFGKQPLPHGLFLQPHKENVDEDETMSLISSIWTPTIKDERVVKKDYQPIPLLVVKIPGKDASLQNEIKKPIPEEDSYETLLALSSDSELSNNCGSDESQDELNDETFGESNSVKSEMTMSNISEATANCEVLKKKFQNGNCQTEKSESTDSDHSTDTIIEKNNKSPKNNLNTTRLNSQIKTKQNNLNVPYVKHGPRRHRNGRSKALASKSSHLAMDSDEVLSISTENLTIQESHSSSRRGGRMSNVKKNIAIETREVLGKKGTTKKITYVRGKIVEETNGPPEKNLKWNTNLCNLNIQRRNTAFPDNSLSFNRTPQTKLVESNSNQLYNTKNSQSSTFRQFKNGRLVVDDCLKMNGHLNFIRQNRRDFFTPPRQDFARLNKEAKSDPLYVPKYKTGVENYQDNRNNTFPKKILPIEPVKAINRAHLERKSTNGLQNYKKDFEADMYSEVSSLCEPRYGPDEINRNTSPKTFLPNHSVEVTNREHLERKMFNASKNYQMSFEEDLLSEVSWNIVKPEKEIARNTIVKKVLVKEMPTQTAFGDTSKFCQKSIEVNKNKTNDQLPNYFQSDTFYDQSNDHFVFPESMRTVKKEKGNIVKPEKEITRNTLVKKVLVKEMPTQTAFGDTSKSCQTSIEVNKNKTNDQLPNYSQSDIFYDQSNDHFVFHENMRTAKKEKGIETVAKSFPKPPIGFCVTENLSFFRSAKLKEERAQKKTFLIKDGKEVADLIVGCHTAVDVFSSFYNEWLELREESIDLLEKITVAIVRCGSKNEKISNLIAGINIAANAAALIPHRGVTLGAKIAAVVGGFVAKLFRNEFTEKDRNAKEFEVKQTFQKDIDTSSMVYIYGVQCSSQFEDTRRAIKDLHQRTQRDSFDLFMTDPSVVKFLKEISEYNPSNEAVFYKRLRSEYERLVEDSRSDECRAFTRVFEVVPMAIPVVDLLPWKFEPDGFDNSIVMNAWEELFSLFNDSGSSNNDEFLRKVQNCLFFLKKEKAILQRNVKSLFK